MNIAIFSDSHDNLPNLTKAIASAREHSIEQGFHLGDFCSLASIEILKESQIRWRCVWGNNDLNTLSHYKRLEASDPDIEKNDLRELEIDGRKLLLTHYPQIARMSALSGLYDACFFGHNHVHSQEMIGKTLLANPGEIYGNRFKRPGFGIYTTSTNTFEQILL